MPYGTCQCAEMIANTKAEDLKPELYNQLIELEPNVWTCLDCEKRFLRNKPSPPFLSRGHATENPSINNPHHPDYAKHLFEAVKQHLRELGHDIP